MTNMYQGVVEDRQDPLLLGRCKVRWMGLHTHVKKGGLGIETKDLPWAHPVQPITSAGVSGIGEAPVGPVEGSWVVGFFRDGDKFQQPVFFGTLGGLPVDLANTDEGFYDPSGKYPLEELIGQPDTNKLARTDTTDTPIQVRRENLDEMQAPAGEGSLKNIKEPETQYAGQYPFNHVRFTESGHLQEFDDTAGAERIHVYHKAGTFEEIYPDGSRVVKVVSDNYTAILGENNIHITKDTNAQLVGDVNVLVNGNVNLEVEGNMDTHVDGDYKLRVDGKIDLIAESQVNVQGSQINLN
tara:strand:+ start:1053 stop:1943 length:891 start_codon:yes stop_codon:yes gene_type:complete